MKTYETKTVLTNLGIEAFTASPNISLFRMVKHEYLLLVENFSSNSAPHLNLFSGHSDASNFAPETCLYQL